MSPNQKHANTNNPIQGILLGFDFGMKRIGVAVGQTVTQSARALATVAAKAGEPDWQTITQLVKKWQPCAFVVGIPLNMDGTEQPITHHAREFCQKLSVRFKLTVFEMDERLTTKDAKEKLFSAGGFKALQDGQVDAMAAQLILQNWLDAENR